MMNTSASPHSISPREFKIKARIKLHSPTSGYAFAMRDDSKPDIYLPPGLMAREFHTEILPQGTTIIVDVADGPRGSIATAIHSSDTSTQGVIPARNPRNRAADGPFLATVKFFNVRRGYGFVIVNDQDVFIHAHAIVRSEIEPIQILQLEGIKDALEVTTTPPLNGRAPEVATIKLLLANECAPS